MLSWRDLGSLMASAAAEQAPHQMRGPRRRPSTERIAQKL
jgi:hypothetical protein